MAEQIKVPGVLAPGTGTYHSYAKDIIDDQLRNKKQSELNALFNQGKGLDANGNVVPVVGPTNADNVPYTDNVPASQHPSGSTGRKIKQLEDRIDSLVPAEEPTLGESVDLADYMMSDNVALSFTYDVSKKYVYGDKVTSMCTYARNNTSYAAFKVVDVDLYIVYTISGNTFTYYAQMDSETLPNEARSKFELGRYALVKQLQGATGDSWVDGTAGVFVGTDERPMAFKYVSSVEINSQTINNVLLARTSNDSYIYVYRLQSGLFKYYTKVASSNAAFANLNALIVGVSGGSSGGVTDYNDLDNKPIFKKSGELGYVFSNYNSATEFDSIAEGHYTEAHGEGSHAEGRSSVSRGHYSHAEGGLTEAKAQYSHAEGCLSNAIGIDSHAEGKAEIIVLSITRPYTSGDTYIYVGYDMPVGACIRQISTNTIPAIEITACSKDTEQYDYRLTLASGINTNIDSNTQITIAGAAHGIASHTEGEGTVAYGDNGHAEGYKTKAYANNSHAEGAYSYAGATASHAEGANTQTSNAGEHAEGRYNLSTPNKTLSSVGFGDSWGRKNAYEVDFDGNIYIYGIGGYDGKNISAPGVKSVQTVIAELVAALTQ